MDDILGQILNWILLGIGSAGIATILLVLASIYVVAWIAKKYIIQTILLLNTWIPSIVLALVTDFSLVQYKVVEPQGISLILFPYTLDLCFGIDSLKSVSFVLILLTYFCFVHIGLMYCHAKKCSKLWAFPIGYSLLIGLGLGMLNFHTWIFDSYTFACISNKIPPPLIPVLMIMLGLIIIFYKYGMKKKAF
jgi:hypothetical protein